MKIIIVLSLIVMTGCSDFLVTRSFEKEMEFEPEGLFVPGRDFQVTSGDNGQAYRSRSEIMKRTPATAYEQEVSSEQRSLETELRSLESRLSEREYRDYLKYTDYFSSPAQRVYFLKLPPRERYDYLASLGVNSFVDQNYRDGLSYAKGYKATYNDIYLGMSKTEVQRIWGSPSRVDVAGNPKMENERWSFYHNGRVKTVFFESGRVEGWEIQ